MNQEIKDHFGINKLARRTLFEQDEKRGGILMKALDQAIKRATQIGNPVAPLQLLTSWCDDFTKIGVELQGFGHGIKYSGPVYRQSVHILPDAWEEAGSSHSLKLALQFDKVFLQRPIAMPLGLHPMSRKFSFIPVHDQTRYDLEQNFEHGDIIKGKTDTPGGVAFTALTTHGIDQALKLAMKVREQSECPYSELLLSLLSPALSSPHQPMSLVPVS